jgi:hypothetical protein
MVETDRRNALQSGLALGLPLSAQWWFQRQATTPVRGRIADIQNNALENAIVQLFSPSPVTHLATTTTDQNGRFKTTIAGDHPTVIYVARYNSWFNSITAATGARQGIMLNRQLLTNHANAIDDDTIIGTVSIWRQVNPKQPSEQIFNIEVLNYTKSIDKELVGILDTERDLKDGWFSLTFPQESIDVDYGPTTSVNITLGDTSGVEIRGVDTPGIDTNPSRTDNRHQHPLVRLHPSVTGLPYAELAGDGYAPFQPPNEALKVAKEGAGLLLGGLPIIGTAIAWQQAIAWQYGDVLDKHGSIDLGLSIDLPRDPNRVDTVFEGWRSNTGKVLDKAAVRITFPLRFTKEKEVMFTAQAEWNVSGIISEHGSLTANFKAGVPQVDDGSGQGDRTSSPVLFETDFNDGLGKWVIGKRIDERASAGSGGWSEKHDGSARLHVDGAPSSIQMWRSVPNLEPGVEITAQYTPSNFALGASNLDLRAVSPSGERFSLDSENDKDDGGEQDGHIEGTVPEDYSGSGELEFHLVIWPGETTVWITEVKGTNPK